MAMAIAMQSIYDSDINTFTSAGANRVLVKPMDMSDFHSAMASVAMSWKLTLTPLWLVKPMDMSDFHGTMTSVVMIGEQDTEKNT